MNASTVVAPKLRRDWIGKRVRLLRESRNRVTCVPSGSILIVEGTYRGAGLKSEPCKCCGVSVFITRVPWENLEFLG